MSEREGVVVVLGHGEEEKGRAVGEEGVGVVA